MIVKHTGRATGHHLKGTQQRFRHPARSRAGSQHPLWNLAHPSSTQASRNRSVQGNKGQLFTETKYRGRQVRSRLTLVHSRAQVPNERSSKLSGSTVKEGPVACATTLKDEMSDWQSDATGACAVTFWQLHWTIYWSTKKK